MVSREELYQLVWSEPMTRVAARFGASGSYMARVCAYLHVPRPERGYWAKHAAGKTPKATPLPPARPGDPAAWTPGEGFTLPDEPPRTPKARKKRGRAQPQTHPLLVGARLHFERSRPTREAGHLRPYKRLLADIVCSAETLDRALAVANDLYSALEARGHRVIIAPMASRLHRITLDEREAPQPKRGPYDRSALWSPDRPTVVYIGTVPIGLAVVEMTEKVLCRYQDGGWVRAATQPAPASRYLRQHDWTTLQDLPSHRLMIVAYSPSWPVQWSQDWREAKQRELRPKTKAIAVAIEKAAEALVPLIEEAERKAEIERLEWAAAEQRRLRAEDRKRVDQSIADSRKQLETIISDWDQATATERFFAGIESHAANLPRELRAPIEERLRLARQMLGTVAPLEWFADWKAPGERYEMQYYGPYPRE